jgi:rhamnopyranosyl-N-acetylglucosaminyl-diphospho-decaprenol beta-1,3/1,4-galactofuranosyltransferase
MSEPKKSPRVAAVFATMNRAATAVACVRALAGQSRPPDLVVVADNVSSDDSVAELENLADLPFPLRVHRMAENAGNAGGVERAMEAAFDHGMDAVWILDDDSWPRPPSLAALLGEPWDPAVVRHALQVDPQSGNFTWPMWVSTDRGWKLADGESELPPGERIPSRASWTGALVSRVVRDAVGPVMGELFIRGEDEEYPWRIERHGFTFEAVTTAVMDHPGASNLVHLSLFGKNFFFEKHLSDWKLYYKIRNMVWLKRRQAGGPQACLVTLAYALAAVRFDGPGRIPLIREAVADGWNGRLGKWRHHP